jgi:hypothetical protein
MVHLIKKDGKVIGWEMKPTTPEEQLIAAKIRDLEFFGFMDNRIVYNGLKLINPEVGKQLNNIESISWVQEKFS